MSNNIIQKMQANAVAREFPKNAYPLKIGSRYVRDEFGHLVITLDGQHPAEPINTIRNANLIVNNGKVWLAEHMIGVNTDNLTYVGVGSGTTAPASTDIDVETPIGSRHIYTDRFRAGYSLTVSTFFTTSENNGTWGNCALFTLVSGGYMYCKSTFATPVTKSSANTQTIDFDVSLS